MWGHLLIVLGVIAAFNLVAILARLWLHTAEEIVAAFIACLVLSGVAFGIEFIPQSPEASAGTTPASSHTTTPATPLTARSAPVAMPTVPPSAPVIEAPTLPPTPKHEMPHASPPPKPPSDPRWQHQRYSVGEPEKPSAAPKETVIIEQHDPRWKYSRYAASADQIKSPSGKPAALFVFHAKSDAWTIPFYPSDVQYQYEATGNVLVRVNGKQTISDLTAINQPDADIQSLSFKSSGSEPVTIYIYPAQP